MHCVIALTTSKVTCVVSHCNLRRQSTGKLLFEYMILIKILAQSVFKAVFDSCLYLRMQCVTRQNVLKSTFSKTISSLRHIQDDKKFLSSRSFKVKSVPLFVNFFII